MSKILFANACLRVGPAGDGPVSFAVRSLRTSPLFVGPPAASSSRSTRSRTEQRPGTSDLNRVG